MHCLSPKFCINYCCKNALGRSEYFTTIVMQNLGGGGGQTEYQELENREHIEISLLCVRHLIIWKTIVTYNEVIEVIRVCC